MAAMFDQKLLVSVILLDLLRSETFPYQLLAVRTHESRATATGSVYVYVRRTWMLDRADIQKS